MISRLAFAAIIARMDDEDKPKSFEETLRAIADEVQRGDPARPAGRARGHRPLLRRRRRPRQALHRRRRRVAARRRPTTSAARRSRGDPAPAPRDAVGGPAARRRAGPARRADGRAGPRAGGAGLRPLDGRARHERARLTRRRPRAERRARARARAARARLDRRRRRGHARRARTRCSAGSRRTEPTVRARAPAAPGPTPPPSGGGSCPWAWACRLSCPWPVARLLALCPWCGPGRRRSCRGSPRSCRARLSSGLRLVVPASALRLVVRLAAACALALLLVCSSAHSTSRAELAARRASS